MYRTIPPLTYKHIENSLTNKKRGDGVKSCEVGEMSIINLFMTSEIYVSRQLTHPLHYQSLHSTLPHYHTYSYISHQHTVSPSFMSLPTVPQYSQISNCFFLFFFSSHTVSFYYFIFLHTIFQTPFSPSPSSSFFSI